MQSNPCRPRTPALVTTLSICIAMALSVAARAGAQPPAAAARTDQLSTEAGVGSPSSAAGVVSYRHGWYLGVAPVIADLHQDALQSLGKAVRFAETGAGARFLVGYAFTESFALELSLLGAGFATDQPGVDGAMANLALDAVAHLRPGRALQPYLTGGLGAVAVGIDGGGFPRQSRQGGQADVGAGLELHVARHFALAADYRYALHGFQREVTRVDPVETRVDIDAQGHAHTWGLRCVYSF